MFIHIEYYIHIIYIYYIILYYIFQDVGNLTPIKLHNSACADAFLFPGATKPSFLQLAEEMKGWD